MKIHSSKEAADYGKGMKSAHCSICRHFEPPRSCEIVDGKIGPDGWCRYFEKRKET